MSRTRWLERGRARRSAPLVIVSIGLIGIVAGCTLTTGGATISITPGGPDATLAAQPSATFAGTQQVIYLVAQDAGSGPIGPIGCDSYLVPVIRNPMPPGTPDQQILVALTDLFSVKDQFYGESGLYNALYQSNLAVENALVDGTGHATISLVGTYLLGGVCDNPVFQAQIEYTAMQVPGVTSASILINGAPIETLLSGQ